MIRLPIFIVYPYAGSVFYEELARRIASACEENSLTTVVCSSAEVCGMDKDRLRGKTVLIATPWECRYELDSPGRLFSRLELAEKRIMVLAEAVEIEWFDKQFRLPIHYDLVVDVGFVSQEDKLAERSIPYAFLFNGPTQREEQHLLTKTPRQRPIPWAFVGHYRDTRAVLADELVNKLGPQGLLFLPMVGSVKKGQGTMSSSGLASALRKAKYYIWNSHHEFAYYESLRFREAVLSGTVPAKVDTEIDWRDSTIPGIYPSVEALLDSLSDIGEFETKQAEAREFYLSGGRLATHLDRVLKNA